MSEKIHTNVSVPVLYASVAEALRRCRSRVLPRLRFGSGAKPLLPKHRRSRVLVFVIILYFVFVGFASAEESVSGFVRDPSGTPIQGTEVLLLANGEQGVFGKSISDTSGYFTVRNLQEGSYSLVAEATGFVRGVKRNVHLKPEERLEIEPLVMSRALSIRGSVKSLITNAAIPGANVWAYQQQQGPNWRRRRIPILPNPETDDSLRFFCLHAVADASGEFSLSGFLPGLTYSLVVEASGCAEEVRQKLDGGAGKIDFTLKPGSLISGRIFSQASKPVGGVTVTLSKSLDMQEKNIDKQFTDCIPKSLLKAKGILVHTPGLSSWTRITDASGSFSFGGLSSGRYSILGKNEDSVIRSSALSGDFRLDMGQELTKVVFTLIPGGRIVGTVKEKASGSPIASATVTLRIDGKDSEMNTRTDREGSFTFSGLEVGSYSVHASSNEFIPAKEKRGSVSSVYLLPGEEKAFHLLMDRAETVTGVVLDAARSPISDATVTCMYSASGTAHTDAKGIFIIKQLQPKEMITIEISAKGYATAKRSGIKTNQKDVEIILSKSGNVAGKVLDSAGAPVQGATVSLQGLAVVQGSSASPRSLEKLSDEKGYFSFEEAEPGLYKIDAQTKMLFSDPQEIRVKSGETTGNLSLVLNPGFAIRGIVLLDELQQSRGIAGATVTVSNDRRLSGPGLKAVSQSDGAFCVQDVPKGGVTIGLQAPEGYTQKASQDEANDVSESSEEMLVASPKDGGFSYSEMMPRITVDDRDIEGIEFHVKREGKVSGRVFDPNGQPVKNAEVKVSVSSGYSDDYYERGESKKTDVDGAYDFFVSTDSNVRIGASAEGYAHGKSESFKLKSGEEKKDVDIHLTLGVSVSGAVTDATGNPVFGANLSLHRSNDYRQVSTDLKGRYSLEDLEPDKITLYCSLPAGLHQKDLRSSLTRELDLTEGKNLENVDFQFNKKNPSNDQESEEDEKTDEDTKKPESHIFGHVVDEADQPIPGCRVSAQFDGFDSAKGGSGWETTDADGVFQFHSLREGEFMVEANSDAFGEATIRATAPADDVKLVLKAMGSITGKVVRATDGQPITEFNASAVGKSEEGSHGSGIIYSSRGFFKFEKLPPGEYTVQVKVKGLAEANVENVIVEGGKTTEVTVQVGAGTPLTGYVLSSAGKTPIKGAKVNATRTDSWGAGFGRTDSDQGLAITDAEGLFRFPNLNPGKYTMTASHLEYSNAKITNVVLEDGQEPEPVEIVLLAGGTVMGHAYKQGGSPASGQRIDAYSMGQENNKDATTDDKGFYEIKHLSSGVYTVMAGGYGESAIFEKMLTTRKVWVEDGETAEVNFGTPGAMIFGTVTRLGEPVDDVTVVLQRGGVLIAMFDQIATSKTNERGYFQINGLDSGRYTLALTDYTLGYGMFVRAEVDVPENSGVYEVNLNYPQSVVAGKVVSGKDGSPIEDAKVFLTQETGNRLPEIYQMFDSEIGQRTIDINAKGEFKFRFVSPGNYRLTATAPEFGQKVLRFEIREDQSIEDLVLELGDFGTLEAKITDRKTGQPVPGYLKILDGDNNMVKMTRNDPFGDSSEGLDDTKARRIKGLNPGTYRITGDCYGYYPQTKEGVEIRVGEMTQIAFALEKYAAQGSVFYLNQDNQPISELQATVTDSLGKEIEDKPLFLDGVLHLGLPLGVFTISAQAPGYEPDTLTLEITEETPEIEKVRHLAPLGQ